MNALYGEMGSVFLLRGHLFNARHSKRASFGIMHVMRLEASQLNGCGLIICVWFVNISGIYRLRLNVHEYENNCFMVK